MPSQLVAALWSVAAVILWVVLATRNPDLTYHFAPLIAAGAWPVAGSRPLMALASGSLTAAAAVGLAASGSMEGPDLVGGDAAFLEAVLFTAAGAAAGAGWAVSRSPRTTSSG